MAKLYLSELSAVLVERHGIDRRIAQRFVTSIVSVVQSGLEADRMVKIKGLGTFKIINVEARESVNVNTGERLVIDGHSKLTFLPDNAMKELVNKPFSQFETVVLNDGVNFDEPEEETPIIDAEEGSTDTVEIEEEEAIVPIVEQEDEKPDETIQTIEDITEDTATETKSKEEVLPSGWISSEDGEDEPETKSKFTWDINFRWVHLVAVALLALLIGGGVGYMIGHDNNIATTASGNIQTQPIVQAEQNSEEPKATEEVAEADKEPQTEEDTSIPIWEKYDGMDPRTKSGYYYITGLDRIEKAKAGDNSARISRRVFGAAELACYIEVFNGIDGRTVLEEGAEVRIPKIESKKNVKKRLEQHNNQQ